MKFMVFLVCFCSANIVCQVYGRDISASKEKLGLNRGMANGLNGGMANGLNGGMANGLNGGMANGLNGGMANGLNGGMAYGLPQMPQVVSGVPLLVFQQPGVPNGQQGQTGLPLTPQLNPNQVPQEALGMPQLQWQLLQLPNGGLQYYVVLPQSNAAGVQQPMNPVQQQVQLQGLPVNVGNCIQQQAIAQAAAVAQAQAQAAVKRVKHSASGMDHRVGENVTAERTIQTLPVTEALKGPGSPPFQPHSHMAGTENWGANAPPGTGNWSKHGPVPGTGMPAVTGEETQVSSGSIATGPALTGEAINPFSV